jgi:polyhydroxyalkanoate synthesis regulator phasin
MMKIAIVLGVLAVLVAAIGYNVWSANQEPVTSILDPLETGRKQLHSQLEEAKRVEAQVEKQGWDSAPQLRFLIEAHKQRIEKLAGNTQAREIVAYDKDSISRLEKRIADLELQKTAEPVAQN